MDNALNQSFSSAQSILFVLQTNPRLDVAAAGLSLANSLEKSGKSTSVVCSTPMTVELSHLVGVQKVRSKLGDKNLIINFVDYDVQGIDTVTYNLESGQFELIVTTKDNVIPPSPSQIKFSYSGISADLVVLVGISDQNQLGLQNSAEILKSTKLSYVGVNPPKVDAPLLFSLSDPAAASVSEIVAKFLDEFSLPFDQDIASNLLYGIETATNNFLSNSTSANTFEAAAICLRKGATRRPQESKSVNQPQPQNQNQRPQRSFLPPQQRPTEPIPAPQPMPPFQQAQIPTTPPAQPQSATPITQPQPSPSPEWLEPKIYTGRTVV